MDQRQQAVGVAVVGLVLVAAAAPGIWLVGQQTIGPLFENGSDSPYLAQIGGVRGSGSAWETMTLPAGSRITIGDTGHEASIFVHSIEIVGSDCVGIASYEVDTGTEGGRIVITNGPHVERITGGRPPDGDTARLTTECPRS
jgi:hypothetical protein